MPALWETFLWGRKSLNHCCSFHRKSILQSWSSCASWKAQKGIFCYPRNLNFNFSFQEQRNRFWIEWYLLLVFWGEVEDMRNWRIFVDFIHKILKMEKFSMVNLMRISPGIIKVASWQVRQAVSVFDWVDVCHWNEVKIDVPFEHIIVNCL